MDSLTHIVIGGALGELTLGKKIGNKAIIIGAVANTIPDLDVFFTKFAVTPEQGLQMHRGFTHAFFFHPFIALPFAFLLYTIFRKKIPLLTCYFVFLSGFITHVLLDGGTTYGTQMLMPFTNKLISWNNLSVVDPLFTIPVLLFFIVVWFFNKENNLRRNLAAISLVLSLIYLGTSTFNKLNSAKVFKQNLQQQNIQYTQFSTTPTMFTSFLWNVLAVNDSMIYVGEYSVFQKNKKVDFVGFKRNIDLLEPVKNTAAVQALLWFSQGNYLVEQGQNDTLEFYNIKWGRGDFTNTKPKEAFRFYFKIYKDRKGTVAFKSVEPDFTRKDFANYFSLIHHRIFD
ncbi:MAG: metal-dependent hydrolase [Chitinophagales bacterium]|nr:metal-dependent hydrolase [Chitinophagales bacterium]